MYLYNINDKSYPYDGIKDFWTMILEVSELNSMLIRLFNV